MTPKIPLTGPLGKIKDSALEALKDPKGTAEKVVEQARGTASVGKSLAGGVVGGVVEQVSSRVPGRRPQHGPAAPETARAERSESPVKEHGDALRDPAGSGVEDTAVGRPQASKATAKKATGKKTTAKTAPATKAPAKKATAKKTPAKKAPTKRAAVAEPATAPAMEDELVYTSETPPEGPAETPPPPRRSDEDAGLIDPSVAKQVAAEAERGRRDAEGPSA